MSEALSIALMLIPLAEGWTGKDGDGGRSWGPYQITQAALDDVNRVYGTHYVKADCYDGNKAELIARSYLLLWGGKLGREPNVRDYVRIFVGGPDGWREHCTLPYWYKCRRALYAMACGQKGGKA